MSRAVTVDEFVSWLKHEDTKKHLWFMDERIESRTLKMKYLNPQVRFSLDTRDLEIYSLSVEGIGAASFRDSNENPERTILDDINDWLALDEKERRTRKGTK